MESVSRRDALKRLGLLGGAALAASCTPARILLHAYPDEFDNDSAKVDRVMAALAITILPEAGVAAAELSRPFYDRRFPLHKYRSYLASDLCARADRLCGSSRFEVLDHNERARVIEDGLSADGTTVKLYSGAIYLAQIAFFAGIYDDYTGCAAIDFGGRAGILPLNEQTYPNADEFLARELTAHGNYA